MTDGLARYRDQSVGVLGMARSGLAAVTALQRARARVLVFDDRPDALAAGLARGAKAGSLADVPGLALIVASPGIPYTHPTPHPVIAAAEAAGVPIAGDIELFVTTMPHGRIAAITGTNGKSTTTALLHHLLTAAGMPALLGGNIGKAVFELEPAEEQPLGLELSSYQLDLVRAFRPEIAVWLNLTPDHLDRHGSLEGYIAVKRRIFMNQAGQDVAIIGVDDEPSAALADELERAGRSVVRVAVGRSLTHAVHVIEGTIVDATGPEAVTVATLDGIASLRGAHNWQNAAAAYAAARAMGLTAAQAAAGFASFAGLPHRMEQVGRVGRVSFVNDSKATNPESATRSLASFKDIYWIGGGLPKPGGFAAILPHLGAVRRAYFIGQAEAEMAAACEGRVPVTLSGTLDSALQRAAEDAAMQADGEPTVLLAPACASFDQFASYEARGDRFRALVGGLTVGKGGELEMLR